MRVLFIGNSHTYVNSMPFIFSNLSRVKSGEPVDTVMLASSGVSLGWHAEQPETQANIRYGVWDYVILQQVAHPFAGRDALFNEAGKLIQLIQKTRAKTVLFMPWASKKAPGAQSEIEQSFTDVAEKLGTLLAPVGSVWWNFLREHPEWELFDSDQEHANPAGSYLAACVFHSLLLERTPEGLPESVTDASGTLVSIPRNQARFIQEFAWKFCKHDNSDQP